MSHNIKVYALVGSSGTGKSYRAMAVASSHDIDYLIDDGLMINGNKKVAGQSAKREHTKVGAVKRALFNDEEHRREVAEAIQKEKPDKILILGTSDEMVQRIAKNLGLHGIDETVYIEEVSTPQEIQIAKDQRHRLGKHVIPVPSVELKRDFSGYFMDKLNILFRRRGKESQIAEKTVVRPTYSYMGNYTIANRTLVQIINHVAKKNTGIAKVQRISIVKYHQGVEVSLDAVFFQGVTIVETCEIAQKSIKEALEWMTNIHVLKISITAKAVVIKTDTAAK